MDRLLAACLDLLYPPCCAACDARLGPGQGPVTEAFCLPCALALEPVPAGACARCADPDTAEPGAPEDPGFAGGDRTGDRRCPRCRAAPPAFDAVVAAGLHGGPLLEAIHAYKYRGQAHLAGPLGRLLAARLVQVPDLRRPDPGPGVVVPIPLHRSRLCHRGFDQAERLAAVVGRALGWPVRPGALRRTRATSPQARLGRVDRAANLAGAFAATRAARGLEGAAVLLVDDVLTTGATAAAAAAPLRAAGARRVTVAVLARADGSGAPVSDR